MFNFFFSASYDIETSKHQKSAEKKKSWFYSNSDIHRNTVYSSFIYISSVLLNPDTSLACLVYSGWIFL